ncbi:MAG: PSD1 and planctomycete cytochrome C domain-containing protein [Gemmataceae bacterium]
MTHRLLTLVFLSACALPAAAQDKADWGHFFETKIRPVLAEHCFSCHGPEKQRDDLRFDHKADFFKGNDDGPIVVPGHPEKSRLIQAILYKGERRMPPKARLPQAVVDDFAAWVKHGAVWPEEKTPSKALSAAEKAKRHWAFQPVGNPPVPKGKDAGWVKTPVDAFILEKLAAKGLTPNPPADRRALLRRLKLDLLGLPPTLEEVEAFEKDTAPDAYEKLVDRYLASPHYGERWARHWLDVARYADTKGYVFTEERRFPYSYTYRDYVIKAFNDDLPFDQFILQQLAADQMVARGLAPKESQAAMGYLTLGRRFLNNIHDIIDDRIDVVARGMLGLTVTCARCHDHKYDPVPMADYYSLYGVFASSTEPKDLPLIGEPEKTPEYLAYKKNLDELEGAVARFREVNAKELAAKNRKFRDELVALQKKVDAFKASSPFAPPRAMILADMPRPVEPVVFLRGKPSSPGPHVKRQFLAVLSSDKREPFKEGSGRLEMARAIASKDNPLTARVFVNRLWLEHFGAGFVTTPSDFGVRSDPPTHPELLDYLARRFMDDGWSIKKLQRLLVLSAVYRQSGAENSKAKAVDPDNRLLARMNLRRLDFEAMRDSILATAGTLDLKMYGRGVDITTRPFTTRRTVYAFIERQNLPGVFRTFDFAGPDASSPGRFLTTVPQQALFLLNSPFMQEQAKALTRRSEIATAGDDEARVRRLYQTVFARAATAEEVSLGRRFLEAAGAPTGAGGMTGLERYTQALLLTNEFMFVD